MSAYDIEHFDVTSDFEGDETARDYARRLNRERREAKRQRTMTRKQQRAAKRAMMEAA